MNGVRHFFVRFIQSDAEPLATTNRHVVGTVLARQRQFRVESPVLITCVPHAGASISGSP